MGRGAAPGFGDAGTDFLPIENFLPAARSENAGCVSGNGGIGMLGKALEATDRFSSGVASVDDGSVEDELKRADEEDVSKSPPLEDELLVPPLPLDGISD